MKKNMTINEYRNANGAHTIFIDNIGLCPDMLPKINSLIKSFTNGHELFFGHYKTDGMNISNKELLLYSADIPKYFTKYGVYQKIVAKNKKILTLFSPPQELIVCRAPNNENTYKILSKVFHYYLETIIFCPKIDWETFVDSYARYMNNVTRDYVLDGYTDFLFSYIDSGDFSITFDPKRFNPLAVRKQVDSLLFSEDTKTKGQGDGLREPL